MMAQTMRTTAAVFVSAVGAAQTAPQSADLAVNFARSNGTVTILGSCRTFQIADGGNRVLVDMAPGSKIVDKQSGR